jgi:hypothetical protein
VGCGATRRSSPSSDRDGSSPPAPDGIISPCSPPTSDVGRSPPDDRWQTREPGFGFRRRSTLHPRPSRRNTRRDRGPVGKPKHVAAPTDGSTGPWRTMTSATMTWPATRLHGSRPTCTSAACHRRYWPPAPRTGPQWGRPRSCANWRGGTSTTRCLPPGPPPRMTTTVPEATGGAPTTRPRRLASGPDRHPFGGRRNAPTAG